MDFGTLLRTLRKRTLGLVALALDEPLDTSVGVVRLMTARWRAVRPLHGSAYRASSGCDCARPATMFHRRMSAAWYSTGTSCRKVAVVATVPASSAAAAAAS